MSSFRVSMPVGGRLAAALLFALVVSMASAGCRRSATGIDESGGFVMRNAADCLPAITLLDQHGQKVSLASLKGKPVLFDFIYTTCPGPCLLLTSHMKLIANRLGPALGTEARIVSITVDPEHDHPPQLLAYAKEFQANVKGWLFLTGTPQQIDQVMARFKLARQRQPDGTVGHVLEFFLVDAHGRAVLQYLGEKAAPQRVASDIERAASGRTVTAGGESKVAATL
jgi:protein SCO1/2